MKEQNVTWIKNLSNKFNRVSSSRCNDTPRRISVLLNTFLTYCNNNVSDGICNYFGETGSMLFFFRVHSSFLTTLGNGGDVTIHLKTLLFFLKWGEISFFEGFFSSGSIRCTMEVLSSSSQQNISAEFFALAILKRCGEIRCESFDLMCKADLLYLIFGVMRSPAVWEVQTLCCEILGDIIRCGSPFAFEAALCLVLGVSAESRSEICMRCCFNELTILSAANNKSVFAKDTPSFMALSQVAPLAVDAAFRVLLQSNKLKCCSTALQFLLEASSAEDTIERELIFGYCLDELELFAQNKQKHAVDLEMRLLELKRKRSLRDAEQVAMFLRTKVGAVRLVVDAMPYLPLRSEIIKAKHPPIWKKDLEIKGMDNKSHHSHPISNSNKNIHRVTSSDDHNEYKNGEMTEENSLELHDSIQPHLYLNDRAFRGHQVLTALANGGAAQHQSEDSLMNPTEVSQFDKKFKSMEIQAKKKELKKIAKRMHNKIIKDANINRAEIDKENSLSSSSSSSSFSSSESESHGSQNSIHNKITDGSTFDGKSSSSNSQMRTLNQGLATSFVLSNPNSVFPRRSVAPFGYVAAPQPSFRSMISSAAANIISDPSAPSTVPFTSPLSSSSMTMQRRRLSAEDPLKLLTMDDTDKQSHKSHSKLINGRRLSMAATMEAFYQNNTLSNNNSSGQGLRLSKMNRRKSHQFSLLEHMAVSVIEDATEMMNGLNNDNDDADMKRLKMLEDKAIEDIKKKKKSRNAKIREKNNENYNSGVTEGIKNNRDGFMGKDKVFDNEEDAEFESGSDITDESEPNSLMEVLDTVDEHNNAHNKIVEFDIPHEREMFSDSNGDSLSKDGSFGNNTASTEIAISSSLQGLMDLRSGEASIDPNFRNAHSLNPTFKNDITIKHNTLNINDSQNKKLDFVTSSMADIMSSRGSKVHLQGDFLVPRSSSLEHRNLLQFQLQTPKKPWRVSEKAYNMWKKTIRRVMLTVTFRSLAKNSIRFLAGSDSGQGSLLSLLAVHLAKQNVHSRDSLLCNGLLHMLLMNLIDSTRPIRQSMAFSAISQLKVVSPETNQVLARIFDFNNDIINATTIEAFRRCATPQVLNAARLTLRTKDFMAGLWRSESRRMSLFSVARTEFQARRSSVSSPSNIGLESRRNSQKNNGESDFSIYGLDTANNISFDSQENSIGSGIDYNSDNGGNESEIDAVEILSNASQTQVERESSTNKRKSVVSSSFVENKNKMKAILDEIRDTKRVQPNPLLLGPIIPKNSFAEFELEAAILETETALIPAEKIARDAQLNSKAAECIKSNEIIMLHRQEEKRRLLEIWETKKIKKNTSKRVKALLKAAGLRRSSSTTMLDVKDFQIDPKNVFSTGEGNNNEGSKAIQNQMTKKKERKASIFNLMNEADQKLKLSSSKFPTYSFSDNDSPLSHHMALSQKRMNFASPSSSNSSSSSMLYNEKDIDTIHDVETSIEKRRADHMRIRRQVKLFAEKQAVAMALKASAFSLAKERGYLDNDSDLKMKNRLCNMASIFNESGEYIFLNEDPPKNSKSLSNGSVSQSSFIIAPHIKNGADIVILAPSSFNNEIDKNVENVNNLKDTKKKLRQGINYVPVTFTISQQPENSSIDVFPSSLTLSLSKNYGNSAAPAVRNITTSSTVILPIGKIPSASANETPNNIYSIEDNAINSIKLPFETSNLDASNDCIVPYSNINSNSSITPMQTRKSDKQSSPSNQTIKSRNGNSFGDLKHTVASIKLSGDDMNHAVIEKAVFNDKVDNVADECSIRYGKYSDLPKDGGPIPLHCTSPHPSITIHEPRLQIALAPWRADESFGWVVDLDPFSSDIVENAAKKESSLFLEMNSILGRYPNLQKEINAENYLPPSVKESRRFSPFSNDGIVDPIIKEILTSRQILPPPKSRILNPPNNKPACPQPNCDPRSRKFAMHQYLSKKEAIARALISRPSSTSNTSSFLVRIGKRDGESVLKKAHRFDCLEDNETKKLAVDLGVADLLAHDPVDNLPKLANKKKIIDNNNNNHQSSQSLAVSKLISRITGINEDNLDNNLQFKPKKSNTAAVMSFLADYRQRKLKEFAGDVGLVVSSPINRNSFVQKVRQLYGFISTPLAESSIHGRSFMDNTQSSRVLNHMDNDDINVITTERVEINDNIINNIISRKTTQIDQQVNEGRIKRSLGVTFSLENENKETLHLIEEDITDLTENPLESAPNVLPDLESFEVEEEPPSINFSASNYQKKTNTPLTNHNVLTKLIKPEMVPLKDNQSINLDDNDEIQNPSLESDNSLDSVKNSLLDYKHMVRTFKLKLTSSSHHSKSFNSQSDLNINIAQHDEHIGSDTKSVQKSSGIPRHGVSFQSPDRSSKTTEDFKNNISISFSSPIRNNNKGKENTETPPASVPRIALGTILSSPHETDQRSMILIEESRFKEEKSVITPYTVNVRDQVSTESLKSELINELHSYKSNLNPSNTQHEMTIICIEPPLSHECSAFEGDISVHNKLNINVNKLDKQLNQREHLMQQLREPLPMSKFIYNLTQKRNSAKLTRNSHLLSHGDETTLDLPPSFVNGGLDVGGQKLRRPLKFLPPKGNFSPKHFNHNMRQRNIFEAPSSSTSVAHLKQVRTSTSPAVLNGQLNNGFFSARQPTRGQSAASSFRDGPMSNRNRKRQVQGRDIVQSLEAPDQFKTIHEWLVQNNKRTRAITGEKDAGIVSIAKSRVEPPPHIIGDNLIIEPARAWSKLSKLPPLLPQKQGLHMNYEVIPNYT